MVEDKLFELAANVTRHLNDHMTTDDDGNKVLVMRMNLDGRNFVARVIQGQKHEEDTLAVDLAKLLVYVRKLEKEREPHKIERVRGSSVRDAR